MWLLRAPLGSDPAGRSLPENVRWRNVMRTNSAWAWGLDDPLVAGDRLVLSAGDRGQLRQFGCQLCGPLLGQLLRRRVAALRRLRGRGLLRGGQVPTDAL